MTNYLYEGDLPDGLELQGDIAVDTEAMGLRHLRDRLCVVQLSNGDGNAHVVQLLPGQYAAPNLKRILTNPAQMKILHFARFDIAAVQQYMQCLMQPVYCTRTASRLVRTYTDKHGYKELCKEILGVDVSKQQQSSDWGAEKLTPEQVDYAASDVLHLHRIKQKLDMMLEREGRTELARACFDFLPNRALLDLEGFENDDLFAHA